MSEPPTEGSGPIERPGKVCVCVWGESISMNSENAPNL